MSTDVLRNYIADGLMALERMEATSRRGKAVSTETLVRLVRENEDIEYGRKYGFREIRSYADYAAKVPFSTYEDYEPYIERMLCFGQRRLITADKVVYYAHTSGSSGASKMIPCTQDALDILFTTVFQRFFGCYDRAIGMPTRPGVNLMVSRFGHTPRGVAHGAISETLNHA